MKTFQLVIVAVLTVGSAWAQKREPWEIEKPYHDDGKNTSRGYAEEERELAARRLPITQINHLGEAATVYIHREDNQEITSTDKHCAKLQLSEILHAKPAYEQADAAVNVTIVLNVAKPSWTHDVKNISISLGTECETIDSKKIAKAYGYKGNLGEKPSATAVPLVDLIKQIIIRE